MKLPKILKRIHFEYETLESISKIQEKGHIASEAETVRQLVKMGIFVYNMKDTVKDESFLNEMKDILKDEQMFDWLQTLTTTQLSGLKQASELVLDGKFKQKQLI